jgi:hypothetical protein
MERKELLISESEFRDCILVRDYLDGRRGPECVKARKKLSQKVQWNVAADPGCVRAQGEATQAPLTAFRLRVAFAFSVNSTGLRPSFRVVVQSQISTLASTRKVLTRIH